MSSASIIALEIHVVPVFIVKPMCAGAILKVEGHSCGYCKVLRTTVWRKPSLGLYPTDIDSATVKGCEVSQEILHILIKYPVTTGISQGMTDGPTLRSKSTGRC